MSKKLPNTKPVNPVAKHAHKYNKAVVMRDRKNDYDRKDRKNDEEE